MKTNLKKIELKIYDQLIKIDQEFACKTKPQVLLNILVSGGKDSICLLYALHAVLNSHKLKSKSRFIPIVTHFNHQKRGFESNQDMYFVQDTCLKLGVECIVKYINPNSKQNFQNYARNERKKIAVSVCEQYATSLRAEKFYILTAHHTQDHVESVLMNLIRGAGLDGLQGFYGKQEIGFLKPFAQIPLKEICKYKESKNIDFREDSSNLSDDYSRNLIRHHILPVFEKLNPQFEKNILNCSQNISKILKINQQNLRSKTEPSTLLEFSENIDSAIIYQFLKLNLKSDVLNISKNTIENILYEASLLQNLKSQEQKIILLQNNKKMTLYKNSAHQVFGTVC